MSEFDERYSTARYRNRNSGGSEDRSFDADQDQAQTTPSRFPDRNGSAAAKAVKAAPPRRLHPIEEAFGEGAQIRVPDHELMPDEPMTDDQLNAWRDQRRAEADWFGGKGGDGTHGANFNPYASAGKAKR